MNQPFQELAERAGFKLIRENCYDVVSTMSVQEFAELIVRECIEQGKQIQLQTVSNGSKDYVDGREMGIEVFMNQIKKHFGVEE